MANKIYQAPETAISFKGSGGTVVFTLASAADQSLSVSAQYDRGAGSKPSMYRWFAKTQVNAAATIGRQVRLYIVQARDATDIPGRLGVSDTEITTGSDRCRNLGTPAGVVNLDSSSATDAYIASGVTWISSQYISAAWFNDTGVALHATEANHYFEIQAIPDEVQ